MLTWTDVQDFGVSPAGLPSDNTAALNAAIAKVAAAGGGALCFPAGVYQMTPGVRLTSNLSLIGDWGAVLKLTGPLVDNWFAGATITDFEMSDLTLDANGAVTTPGYAFSLVSIYNGLRVALVGCQFKGWDKFGVGFGNTLDCEVDGCTFTRNGGPDKNQNQAISASGHNTNLTICGNRLYGSGMDLDIESSSVASNIIKGFGFGGGITTEQSMTCKRNIITRNIVTGGVGVDVNQTRCPGLELWDAYSVVSNNVAYWNAGDGIDIGGLNTSVTGNVAYGNGQGSKSYAGIALRYGTNTYNCNGSVLTGNRAFDGSGCQAYGLVNQQGVTRVTAVGNDFNGNLVAPAKLTGLTLLTGNW